MEPFSNSVDAKILREQLEKTSNDVDRDKIVKLWFHRSYQQRKEIESYYDKNLCSMYQIVSNIIFTTDFSLDLMNLNYDFGHCSIFHVLEHTLGYMREDVFFMLALLQIQWIVCKSYMIFR